MQNLFYSDLAKDVSELIEVGSQLKLFLMKKTVLRQEVVNNNTKIFITKSSDFVSRWYDYAMEQWKEMKNIKSIDINENKQVVEYGYIKQFIFGKPDYASMLKFTDGLLKGFSSNLFMKPSDVNDFKNHTISLAFHTDIFDTAGLLSQITRENIQMYSTNMNRYEYQMFQSIKQQSSLFDISDKFTIIKSIKTTLDFLLDSDEVDSFSDTSFTDTPFNQRNTIIQIIHSVVDYILYTLTSYAVKSYIVSYYALPYIEVCKYTKPIKSISESFNDYTTYKPDITDFLTAAKDRMVSNIWNSTDQMFIKDINKKDQFIGAINEFIKLIGAKCDDTSLENNKICLSLKENDLYCFLHSHISSFNDSILDPVCELEEYYHQLYHCLYNRLVGLAHTATPRDEFLNYVKKSDYYDSKITLDNIQKLSVDLYVFSKSICSLIIHHMSCIKTCYDTSLNSHKCDPRLKTPSAQKLVPEILLSLSQFYEDYTFTVSQKLGFLEMHANSLFAKRKEALEEIITINEPIVFSPETHLSDAMSLSMSDTSRVSLLDTDIFRLDAFASLNAYKESIMLYPEFSDDLYLNEAATDIDQMIAAAIAFIQKARLFFTRNFKPAIDWVVKNKNELQSISSSFDKDSEIRNIFYYQMDLKQNGGTITKINGIDLEKMIAAITRVKTSDLNGTNTTWKNNIYNSISDSGIRNKFIGNAPDAIQAYTNLILFNATTNAKPIDYPTTKINLCTKENTFARNNTPNWKSNLPEQWSSWISDIESTDEIFNSFNKYNTQIMNHLNSLKNSTVTEYALLEATPPTATPPTSDNSDTTSTSGTDKTTAKVGAPNSANTGSGLMEIVNKLWKPIMNSFERVLRDEYSYIRQVYYASRRSIVNNQNQNNQQ